MPLPEIVPGRRRGWNLIEKLGEGDAGEIYRVEAMMDRQAAILKRPRRGAFPSDIIRQASQIEKESRVLAVLSRLTYSNRSMQPPGLLDQSKAGTEFTERYFMIMDPAAGADLVTMARIARYGLPDEAQGSPTSASPASQYNEGQNPNPGFSADQLFIKHLASTGSLPHLLLLRLVSGLIDYLETVHSMTVDTPTGKVFGILWNDVKPNHIFWDPKNNRFTLIDWGNAQFLEADGATQDRQYSRLNDFEQFLDEFGRFLATEAPDLHAHLEWPIVPEPASIYTQGVIPLKERIAEQLEVELESLRHVREQEIYILNNCAPDLDNTKELFNLQREILSFGELPDIAGSERYFNRLAQSLVIDSQLDDFRSLCEIPQINMLVPTPRMELLTHLASILEQGELSTQALLSALDQDWPAVMWEMRLSATGWPEPAWLEDLNEQVRQMGIAGTGIRPWVAANRMLHTLVAASQRTEDPGQFQDLVQQLRELVLPRHTQVEPDPPDAGISYIEFDRLLEAAREILPDAVGTLDTSLVQPRKIIRHALDAWGEKDFGAAARWIRLAVFWDPERRRYLNAERLVQSAPLWLADVRNGMLSDEPMQDMAARLELRGRELRQQVGPAGWLDALLEAFKQLRRGAHPAEVLVQNPEVREDLGWLIALEPRSPVFAEPGWVMRLERGPEVRRTPMAMFGQREVLLGPDGLDLGDPLDTWAPEARGSSARLFAGNLPNQNGEVLPAAIKIMRPDRAEYALPLFREETRILSLMQDVPGVAPMLEAGFIHLEKSQLPSEERDHSATGLQGTVRRYSLNSLHNYLVDLDSHVDQGWIPYLAIELQNPAENLLLLTDTGRTHGHFLPILEGLVISIQICDILEAAHARNIVYRDHKILHYYWQQAANAVYMIDWNVAKRYPEGLTAAETQFDLVQLGARALHYIFTGRPAPGALPMGPNRPEEIEAAAHSYAPQWTYDDQRLPIDIKDLMEAILTGAYTSSRQLRDDLVAAYDKFSTLVKPQ